MKILLIVSDLGQGGLQSYIANLSHAMIHLKNEVHLIVFKEIVQTEINDNVKIHFLTEKNEKIGRNWISEYKLARKLRKKIQELETTKKFDLIFSNHFYGNQIAYKAGIKKAIFVIHNTFSKTISKSKKIKFLRRRIKYNAIYQNQSIVSVSQGAAEDLIKYAWLKKANINVIPNPFNIADIQSAAEVYDKAIPIEPYIINVGRFKLSHKQQNVLIQILPYINKKYKLVLLGDGEDREKIETLITQLSLEDRVILAGWQTNPFPWIKNARLLVHTARFEGFGNILAEALICKTPVISYDCPSGPSEILTGPLAKYLIKPGDTTALINTINEALENPPEIKANMYNKFSDTEIAKKYIFLYK